MKFAENSKTNGVIENTNKNTVNQSQPIKNRMFHVVAHLNHS